MSDAPYFVNEEGVKWWIEKDPTDYGVSIGLQKKKFVVYRSETPDGEIAWHIMYNNKPQINSPYADYTSMLYAIDVLHKLRETNR